MIVCFHRNKQTVNKYKLKFERKFSKKSHFYYMGDMFMTGSLGSQLDCRENEFFELKGNNSMPETFLLVQACLRAPPVVADEAKLAIVFTYFFLFSSFFFFFFSTFYFSPTSEKLPWLK